MKTTSADYLTRDASAPRGVCPRAQRRAPKHHHRPSEAATPRQIPGKRATGHRQQFSASAGAARGQGKRWPPMPLQLSETQRGQRRTLAAHPRGAEKSSAARESALRQPKGQWPSHPDYSYIGQPACRPRSRPWLYRVPLAARQSPSRGSRSPVQSQRAQPLTPVAVGVRGAPQSRR